MKNNKELDDLLRRYLTNRNEEDLVKIIIHYRRYIKYITNVFLKAGKIDQKEIEDYSSAGLIGLVNGINNFGIENYTDEKSFLNYVHRCIYNAIFNEIETEKKIKCIKYIDSSEAVNMLDENVDFEYFIEAFQTMYKKEKIRKFINKLHGRRKDMIIKYFGLDEDGKQYNQREIAEMYGISSSNVSRLILDSLDKISVYLKDFELEYTSKKPK